MSAPTLGVLQDLGTLMGNVQQTFSNWLNAFANFFDFLFRGFTSGFTWLATAFYNAFAWIGQQIFNLGNWFYSGFVAIGQALGAIGNFILNALIYIGNQLYNFGQWLYNQLVAFGQLIMNALEGLWNALVGVVNYIWNTLVGAWNNFVAGINNWWVGILQVVRSKMQQLIVANLTITATWKAGERFQKKPSVRNLAGIVLVPIGTYIASSIIAAFITSFIPIPSTTPFQLVPPLNIGQLNIGTTTLSRTITTTPPTAPPTPSVGGLGITSSLPSTQVSVTHGNQAAASDDLSGLTSVSTTTGSSTSVSPSSPTTSVSA